MVNERFYDMFTKPYDFNPTCGYTLGPGCAAKVGEKLAMYQRKRLSSLPAALCVLWAILTWSPRGSQPAASSMKFMMILKSTPPQHVYIAPLIT